MNIYSIIIKINALNSWNFLYFHFNQTNFSTIIKGVILAFDCSNIIIIFHFFNIRFKNVKKVRIKYTGIKI